MISGSSIRQLVASHEIGKKRQPDEGEDTFLSPVEAECHKAAQPPARPFLGNQRRA